MTVPRDGIHDDEPIGQLLRRLRPELEETLGAYRLDEREAEEVLSETLHMLIYRWDRIGNRDLWLLATLKRSCLSHTWRRGRRGGLAH